MSNPGIAIEESQSRGCAYNIYTYVFIFKSPPKAENLHSMSISLKHDVVRIGLASKHNDRAGLLSIRSSGDVKLMTSTSHPPSIRPHYQMRGSRDASTLSRTLRCC